MTAEAKKPNAGDIVVLLRLPPGLLNDLPEEDQKAIAAIVGVPVSLVGYDENGRAELGDGKWPARPWGRQPFRKTPDR